MGIVRNIIKVDKTYATHTHIYAQMDTHTHTWTHTQTDTHLDTLPLKFFKDDITWLVLKISGAAVSLGAEALKFNNWLLRFGCTSDELQVEVVGITDFLEKLIPPLGIIQSPDVM